MGDNGRPGDAAPVVITGTSTGIGAASALLLAEKGFRVFAGVRNAADGEALVARTSGELTPISDRDHRRGIDLGGGRRSWRAQSVERGLFGLVNNAGIVKPGPLEFQPMADFRRQLEVNLIGQVAMTQAFLPLIRRGKGRIVNVGSIGGRVVLPLHGAYSASKFGMEAVSDALRLELRQWRIPVSHIDPGATETAIFGKTLAAIDEMEKTLREQGHARVRRADREHPAPGREDRRRRGAGRRPLQDRREGAHGQEAEVPLPGRPRCGGGRGARPHGDRRDQGPRRAARGASAGAGVAELGRLRRRERSESRRCRPSCPVSCPAGPPTL